MTIDRSPVRKAPSDSPLYGKTFICKGYGMPIRPPEKRASIESRVSIAPSDSPLYGKTFICRGYGKPTRPPEKVEGVPHTDEVDKTQDSTSNNDKESASLPNDPDKDKGGKS